MEDGDREYLRAALGSIGSAGAEPTSWLLNLYRRGQTFILRVLTWLDSQVLLPSGHPACPAWRVWLVVGQRVVGEANAV